MIGELTSMRMLRVCLIPVIPGLFVFAYIWVVDGGGDIFTCVPILFARWLAGWLQWESSLLLRRAFISAYLLMFEEDPEKRASG